MEKSPSTNPTVALVYFSSTGTTRKVLNAIAKGLNTLQAKQINLTRPSARQIPPPRIDEQILVLGMPVYEEHIPAFVVPMLTQLSGKGQPAVVVAVYGHVGFGLALQEMAEIIETRGFNVIAGAAFIGEHSFSNPKLPLAAGRPNESDLEIAEDFGKQIAAKLNNGSNGSITLPGKLPLMSKILPRNSSSLFAYPPTLIKERCVQCGVCAQVCPMGAIDVETLEINTSKCVRCFACARACKYGAREIKLRNKIASYPFLKNAARKKLVPQIFMN